MGSSSSLYIKEKDNKNNVISVPNSALKVIADLAEKCICKIIYDTPGSGTGFFCTIPFPDKYKRLPVMITNYHVLEESNVTIGSNIKFSLNNDLNKFQITIDEKRKVYTNEIYDITIIEIKDSDHLDTNTFLDIDEQINDNNPKKIYENKSVYILHYPHGNISEYSSGLIKEICEEDSDIYHSCQSRPGSSGSPIINLINHKVIGIHKGSLQDNEDYNLGTFIKEPIKDFNNRIKDANKINVPSSKYLKDKIKILIIIKNDLLIKYIQQEQKYVKNYDKEDENDLKILYQNFFFILILFWLHKSFQNHLHLIL